MKVFYFIQGWFRHYLYYGNYRNDRLAYKAMYLKEIPNPLLIKWNSFVHNLLSISIRQQIEKRIKSSQTCIEKGQCIICKCDTPALQMANKACDKPCYPAMINKKDWEEFYGNGEHIPRKWYYCKETKLEWSIFDNKFITKQEYLEKRFKNE